MYINIDALWPYYSIKLNILIKIISDKERINIVLYFYHYLGGSIPYGVLNPGYEGLHPE